MRKVSVFLLTAMLVTCSFSPHIGASEDSKGQPNSRTHLKERSKTEFRKGASVAQRAKQLRATNKGFAKAYAELLKRGGKPVFEEAGMSVVARDSQKSQFMKASTSTTQSLTEGDYEMTFFPFDTGDDAVWEGAIYVKGAEGEETWAVSFDTTVEDLSTTEIYYENYYGPEGREIEIDRSPGRVGGSSTKPRFVAAGSRGASNGMVYQKFRSWLNCVAAECYAASRACLWTGPFFFICFHSWCGGAMISCIPPLNL